MIIDVSNGIYQGEWNPIVVVNKQAPSNECGWVVLNMHITARRSLEQKCKHCTCMDVMLLVL